MCYQEIVWSNNEFHSQVLSVIKQLTMPVTSLIPRPVPPGLYPQACTPRPVPQGFITCSTHSHYITHRVGRPGKVGMRLAYK